MRENEIARGEAMQVERSKAGLGVVVLTRIGSSTTCRATQSICRCPLGNKYELVLFLKKNSVTEEFTYLWN